MASAAIASLTHPPEAVVAFVNRLVREQGDYGAAERRSERRRDIAVTVKVQPLDEAYRSLGEPISTLTCNLSGGGLGFIYHRSVDAPFVEVELTTRRGESMKLLASVRHCTQVDDHFRIGARFVVRWDESARHVPESL